MTIQVPSKFIFKKGDGPLEESIARQLSAMYDDLYLTITTFDKSIYTLDVYADNAAALAGGLVVGQLYRNNANPDAVCIVH